MNFYRANSTKLMPNVKVEERKTTIRYPQRLWLLARCQRMAEIELSTAISWQIVIQSGGSEVTTALGSLDLLELDAKFGQLRIKGSIAFRMQETGRFSALMIVWAVMVI